MTPEEINALFARWREAAVSRDPVALAALYANDCILESQMFGRRIGRAAIESSYREYWTAFPDAAVEFGECVVTGNRVTQTGTIYGTDTGGLFGHAPTGNQFRILLVQFCELNDAQIVHERRVSDVNGVLLQLATGHGLGAETSQLYHATLARVRMEHDLKTAAEIQKALLPAPHYKGVGVEMAVTSVACRAIGGDFLDYFDLPNGALGFVLGDVAGKGPPAALLAAKLQGMVAAYSNQAFTPSETLRRINEELVRRTIESRFATMFYGVLSHDGRLTYCNGGHNPPFIVGKGGVRRLERGGLILGAFQGAKFEEDTVELDRDDVLVVFSDGVTEALNPDGVEFGESRLLSSITANLESMPTVLLDSVLAAVREFSAGAEQNDDLTALVLRYTGS